MSVTRPCSPSDPPSQGTAPSPAPSACFVTGLHEDDGEHLASLALIHALRTQHFNVAAMTPLVSGSGRLPGHWASAQLQRLAQAGSVAWPVTALCPYCLPMASTLAEAVRLAGVTVDPEVVMDTLQVLATWTDIVVMQGAGGLATPIGPEMTVQQLAARLRLPLVLALRPAPDGETRASEAAAQAQAAGLQVAAWVATPVDGEPSTDTIEHMRQVLADVPCLGMLPRRSDREPDAAALAARALDGPRLVAALRAALPPGVGSRTARLQSTWRVPDSDTGRDAWPPGH